MNKKRLIDLSVLAVCATVIFLVWQDMRGVILFSLGFIWNWVAAQELAPLYENKRYRFSMLKTVMNLQNIFLKPFGKFPEFVRAFVRTLPAGFFWTGVIVLNDADMPWYATFIGSMVFELSQLRFPLFNRHKDLSL